MIVIDASAVIELLLASESGIEIVHRIRDGEETLHAPHLLDLEVVQVLRRSERAGLVDASRALEALGDLGVLGIVRHDHEGLLDRVWELRENLTAYDAAYVALAEALDAPLLTRDAKIAAAPGHRARVELVSRPGTRAPGPRPAPSA